MRERGDEEGKGTVVLNGKSGGGGSFAEEAMEDPILVL